MRMAVWLVLAVAATATFLVVTAWADVPAPPVNQTLFFKDTVTVNLSAAVCSGCHVGNQADRHHTKVWNTPLPPANLWYSKYSDPTAPDPVPYAYAPYTVRSPSSTTAWPAGRDPEGSRYNCVSCHSATFVLERNCVVCHQRSPHHATLGNPDPAFPGRDHKCGGDIGCHGSAVDNYNDGHYIPTYAPSLVTPHVLDHGTGLPANSRGTLAGSCEYCHDADLLSPHVIFNNHDTHHNAKFTDFGSKCVWCHGTAGRPASPYNFRNSATDPCCENCHGPTSLHAIQASSKTPPGTPVVAGELAGYGHVGRDAYDATKPNGDSDCWGCHGFAMGGASAPNSGPLIPTVYDADKTTLVAGKAATVVLTGAVFTNIGDDGTVYESKVTLTASNGTSVTLTPDVIVDQGTLAVTIPAGTTKPGTCRISTTKVNPTTGTSFSSNPAVVTVIPTVWIGKATAQLKTVTITGGGFAGFQKGSGKTNVSGTTSTGATVWGTVVSWAPGKIVAKFGTVPTKVKVVSVFGKATHAVVAQ